METTSKFPEVSMVSRIGLLQPPKMSLLKSPEPVPMVPAMGEDFTDTVKCRPREGRLSWMVFVVHGITDSSQEAESKIGKEKQS